MTHICVSKLSILGSDNGLSPGRRQAIIRTNAGILLIGPLGTNFNEIFISIQTFSLKKMRLKMSSAKWRPFCLGLNVLMPDGTRPLSEPVLTFHWLGVVAFTCRQFTRNAKDMYPWYEFYWFKITLSIPRGQWVKALKVVKMTMTIMTVRVITFRRLVGAKPLSEPMLEYC